MHGEILNNKTFPLLQVSVLFSSPIQIIVAVVYGSQIRQIYEDNLQAFNTRDDTTTGVGKKGS